MATKKLSKEKVSARKEALREEYATVIRETIKTEKLLRRLEAYALGETLAGKPVKLSAGEIKAMEILFDKTLPNLASVKHEVDAKQVVFLIDTQADGNPNNQVSATG